MNGHYAFAEIPLGEVLIASNKDGICFLSFTDGNRLLALEDFSRTIPHAANYTECFDKLMSEVVSALAEAGRTTFHFPLALSGTEFQRKVWQALLEIPFGERVTYKEVALRLGMPKAVRAVATAIGQNHIAILIPCHRVVRDTGALAGYRWGLERKHTLLESEQN